MSLEAATAEFIAREEQSGTQRIAVILGWAIYVALLTLLILTALAYGGADPWWKAFFTSLVFAIAVFASLEMILSDTKKIAGLKVLLPILVLVSFSLLQTVHLPQSGGSANGISYRLWNAISADPYETRVFALQLFGLAVLGALLFRYAADERRLRLLIQTIIGIALVSAVFGLLRQTAQHQDGFLLPALLREQGYGQFINKNHFAYVMEVGLGLALGLIAAGGVRRERVLVYVAVLLPIWTALVLANSRGGILAMLVQLVVTLLLFPIIGRPHQSDSVRTWRLLKSRAVRVILIFVLLIMVLVGVLWTGGDRLASNLEAARIEFTQSPQTSQGVTRLQIWSATISMIKANPIFGVGMGGYWTAIPSYHVASGSMTPQQAHNDYLEILASGGIVGLAIVGWFVIVVLKQAGTNLQSRDEFQRATTFAAVIAITGLAIHSIVDFGLHRMLNAMLFTALVVIATSNVRQKQSPEKS